MNDDLVAAIVLGDVAQVALVERSRACNLNDQYVIKNERGPDWTATPLIVAASMGHTELVQALVDRPDIDVNGVDEFGCTALMVAAKKGQVQVVRQLVATGKADINYQGGMYNDTALYKASLTGQADVVFELLQHPHIDVNVPNQIGQTPLVAAAVNSHYRTMDLLLKYPTIDRKSLHQLLLVACKFGMTTIATALLATHDLDVNVTDELGETPLMGAANICNVEIVSLLLANEAIQVNAQDSVFETALLKAVKKDSLDVVQLLLAHGADVSLLNMHGESPLTAAAGRGSVAVIALLLASPGSQIDVQDTWYQQTALVKATIHGNLPVVELLLKHGADTSIPDKDGYSCLGLALQHRQYQAAVTLIAGGVAVTNVCFQGKLVLEWVAPHLTHDVAVRLLRLDLPVEMINGVVTKRDNHSFSWTTLLDSHFPLDSALRMAVVSTLLSDCTDDWIRELATAKDQHGREALQTTGAATRDFLNSLRFFCGRYELFDGPPIYVSSTAVVVNAYDHGVFKQVFDTCADKDGTLDKAGFEKCRRVLRKQRTHANSNEVSLVDMNDGLVYWALDVNEYDLWDKDKSGRLCKDEFLRYCSQAYGDTFLVAMKFMRNADERAREVETRHGLDTQFVLGLLPSLPQETFRANVGALKMYGDISMKDYPNVLVMPAADRSLEDIFLKERPNDNQIRSMLHDIAKALQHLHNSGVVHGDLKKLNVLRVNNHMRLIDMDAATPIGKPVGAKFSSGTLPPEMFYKLKHDDDAAMVDAHWRDHISSNPDLWAKVQPREGYCVKTFHDLGKSCLPFKPVKASPALDVWAFGVLMYQMYSGVELVSTDINQDVDEGGIVRAASWTDTDLAKRINNKVSNALARDLMTKLLAVDLDDRMSVDGMLAHPYFQVNFDPTMTKVTESLVALTAKVDVLSSRLEEVLVVSKETLKAVGQAKADLMRGIFEATEVAFPTSFVILSVDLTTPLDAKPEYVLNDSASFVQRGIQLVGGFMDAVKDNQEVGPALQLGRPGDPLFLYLIDEVNGAPVIPDSESLYPIRIDTRSVEYTTFMAAALPYLESGCQLLKGVNTVAAFMSCLGVPSLDGETMDKLVDQLESAKKPSSVFDFDVVQSALESEGVPVQHIRGAALRELERFFNNYDVDKDYSGLCRTYALNGQAVWTTKDTIEQVDQGRSKCTPALKPRDPTVKGGGKTAQQIYTDLLVQNHATAHPPAPSMPQHGDVKPDHEKSCCATM